MNYNMRRIFICGVHGVGKSDYTKNSKVLQRYTKYTCSELIKNYSGLEFKNKKITNVNRNQNILLNAVNHYVHEVFVLLDGRIVLFNKNNEIEIVEPSIFEDLRVEHIILLKANPKIIYERLLKRDGNTWLTLELIEQAQKTEEEKVIEYSNSLDISYEIYEWNQMTNQWENNQKDARSV